MNDAIHLAIASRLVREWHRLVSRDGAGRGTLKR